jgi:alginate O-acetyltransferase complex protein AlgI
MSYPIDVYRGQVEPQKSFLRFGTFVALFPQLIAGPIVRYRDVSARLEDRPHSFDRFGEGVKRFVTGLGKKVLLANNIGLLWSAVSQTPAAGLSVLGAWMGLIACGFQIYFDFSGYSDMAIGLGKLLGFDFPENFNYPFLSKSVTEFWRRWHISLGSWFRDYVYIPLGGSRRGLAVQLRNIAVVWLLTGLWHGASWSFVLWGLYFGVLLVLEKLLLLRRLERVPALGRVWTLLAVTLSWVLFSWEDLAAGTGFVGALFGGAPFVTETTLYQLRAYLPLLVLCAVSATPLLKRLYAGLCDTRREGLILTADLLRVLTLFGLSLAFLVSGSYNPFLYFRF